MDSLTEATIEMFASCDLVYADIGIDEIKDLRAFCDIELGKCRLYPKTPLHASMRMAQRIECERCDDGGMAWAALYVDGHYFNEREAISLDGDGTIRIAGWADSKNVEPFRNAFARWVARLVMCRDGRHEK